MIKKNSLVLYFVHSDACGIAEYFSQWNTSDVNNMVVFRTSCPLQTHGCKLSVLLTVTYVREKWVIKMYCESSYSISSHLYRCQVWWGI